MLNKMVTSKTPCKTLNLHREKERALETAAGFLTLLHTQERITSVHRCVIHAEQKEKERCHVRGTFYNAGKAFLQICSMRFREGKMQEKEVVEVRSVLSGDQKRLKKLKVRKRKIHQ